MTKEGAGGLPWVRTPCSGHPPESLGRGCGGGWWSPQCRQDHESSHLLFWFLLLKPYGMFVHLRARG